MRSNGLKRVEAGFAVPDICRPLDISTVTFYKWRAKYGGMDVSMMSRMRELEDENRRLKKMYLEEKLNFGWRCLSRLQATLLIGTCATPYGNHPREPKG